MTTSDRPTTSAEVLAEAVRRLEALDLADAFEPAAAEAIVASGLHRLVVPVAAGGLGGRMAASAEALLAIGAVDGSTALGFAMQLHVIGALVDGDAVPTGLRDRLFAQVVTTARSSTTPRPRRAADHRPAARSPARSRWPPRTARGG